MDLWGRDLQCLQKLGSMLLTHLPPLRLWALPRLSRGPIWQLKRQSVRSVVRMLVKNMFRGTGVWSRHRYLSSKSPCCGSRTNTDNLVLQGHVHKSDEEQYADQSWVQHFNRPSKMWKHVRANLCDAPTLMWHTNTCVHTHASISSTMQSGETTKLMHMPRLQSAVGLSVQALYNIMASRPDRSIVMVVEEWNTFTRSVGFSTEGLWEAVKM